MNIRTAFILLLAFCSAGCGSVFQGIKLRGESPSIEEAFRKLSIAVAADSFEITSMHPDKFSMETGWRQMKENEKRTVLGKAEDGTVRLLINLERRGRLYDVFLTTFVQVKGTETVTGVGHPLTQKWKRILNTIVQRESREED